MRSKWMGNIQRKARKWNKGIMGDKTKRDCCEKSPQEKGKQGEGMMGGTIRWDTR